MRRLLSFKYTQRVSTSVVCGNHLLDLRVRGAEREIELNREEIVVVSDARNAASRVVVLEVEHVEGNENVCVANPLFASYQ